MARRRFFVPEVIDGRAEITGEDAHHLARVLRVEPGQHFEISEGRGVYLAEISHVEKNAVRFQVLETLDPGPPLPPISLFVSLIKFDRFEWIVEKATELGVARIVPVEAARSEHALLAAAAKRVERWRKIARESSQQSRRLSVPEIGGPCRLSTPPQPDGMRLRLEEEPGAPPLLSVLAQATHYSVLVGPEGGWLDSERELLRRAEWLPVSLGPTILRAETAAIAASSTIAQWWWNENAVVK